MLSEQEGPPPPPLLQLQRRKVGGGEEGKTEEQRRRGGGGGGPPTMSSGQKVENSPIFRGELLVLGRVTASFTLRPKKTMHSSTTLTPPQTSTKFHQRSEPNEPHLRSQWVKRLNKPPSGKTWKTFLFVFARNMSQAQQQYGGQKQYMYNASMTLKNQGNDEIKARGIDNALTFKWKIAVRCDIIQLSGKRQ